MADWDTAVEEETTDGDSREHGTVLRWTEKGFGFIETPNRTDKVFCHVSETPNRAGLVAGSKVSFRFEPDEKSGKARDVQIEEAAVEQEESQEREIGTVKRWNAEKGFGFIGRATGGDDAFVHKKDCGGKDLAVGQAVSFVYKEGPKGAAAKDVQQEEGAPAAEPVVEEEEGERELGKVKSFNEEKGFVFIGRCIGGDDLFSHKKEFGGITPYVGQPVSFVVEATEKGDAAKKVREEESVPEPPLSDEGREFGKVKNFMSEKRFGFIICKSGEEAIVFEKQCNGLTLEKDMCVSFEKEDGEKGPIAKDVRQEDPARVAKVTAKVHYGKVDQYFDPTAKKPTNGYGFIVPFDPPSYGAPKRYFFHMSEIDTPDEDGGIEPGTGVSFIIVPAKKGVQAIAVTVADPPPKDNKENIPPSEATTDNAEAGWGTGAGWGTAEAEGGTWGQSTDNTAVDGWGQPVEASTAAPTGEWGKSTDDKDTATVAVDGWGQPVEASTAAPANEWGKSTDKGNTATDAVDGWGQPVSASTAVPADEPVGW